MKLTSLLLIVACLQVSATTLAQRVTLHEKNATLSSVLIDIRQQTGYDLFYKDELIKDQKVTIDVKDEPLAKVLTSLLESKQFSFTITDKTITIQRKEETLLDRVKKYLQAFEVNGKVTDEHNQPLPGATVTVKGTDNVTMTDVNGNFNLKNINPNGTLIISYIGFERKEVAINAKTTIEVILTPTNDQLHDVVISGYTVQNRAEFTGSSSHIAGNVVENRPVASFDQALAGQAAGVKITSNGGSLNAPPVIRIRGTNSINLSSYPLIVIDGVTSFSGNVGLSAVVENNPLASINPNDIASIEILKDASATAIYGSRAANGVVVITTKKGKAGKVKVNYDGYFSITKRPKLPELLDAADYVTIKDEAQTNSGLKVTYFLGKNADGSVQQTNWYDYFYKTGYSQNHNVSISGATDATNYYISANYDDQNGFLVKNTFNRKSARANVDHRLLEGLHIGINFAYSNSVNNNLNSVYNSFGRNNLARESMVLPPNVLAYNADGSYNISGNSLGLGPNAISVGYFNPLPMIDNDKYSSESNNATGLFYAEWELFKGLKIKTNYSINSLNITNLNFNNPIQGNGFSSNGSAGSEYDTNYRTDFTNTLSYSTTLAKNHHLSVLAGYEGIQTISRGFSVTRTGLTDPYFQSFAGGFTNISDANGTASQNGYRSYFSNLFYDFQKKYLLSASFRKDGFSGLAITHKYGNFGGGSVGWNLSQEDFYRGLSLAKTLSDVKLRASYGQVGNVNIGDYAASSLYGSTTYGGVAGLIVSQTGNTNLHWETSKKTDIGINLGFWQNKITLDADYYNNTIDGLILAAPQSPSKGIPGNSINTNVGSMYNRGFEFDLQAHVIDKGAFRWTAGLNFSTLKNRVTALVNNTDIWTNSLETSNITRVGYSVGSVYVVKTTGVNPANGLRTYINRNGATVQYNPVTATWSYLDGSKAPAMDAYGDGVVMGPTLPTYYGGFNNTFRYGNFDLYVNIVFSGGNQIYNGTKATLLNNNFFNNKVDILRRWTTPGQVTDIPKVYYNDQQASGSVLPNSYNVESGAYIKLGTAALGYTIPTQLYRKAGVSSIRIYGSAGNIILHTKYTGSDPEVSANGDSNTAAGRDKNLVPAGRTFTFGLNVGF
ncbi:SusC/RagA family TonB-linked outer membrane protein [Mucilaginibacter ximonensis]|uniref:SusC/RagA family TonB-linked outer membrane protein n=1 Tax=Mucilaginibacter ximonensis TaxID=538021 RepID=A0ABW5Y6A7_9SPHI